MVLGNHNLEGLDRKKKKKKEGKANRPKRAHGLRERGGPTWTTARKVVADVVRRCREVDSM